ncbi:hypothetical protein B0H03_1421, partial [Rathayibacter iranicus NCPPB 2253 = VKM Ac-1602]
MLAEPFVTLTPEPAFTGVVFTAEQFDTLSVGEVIVGDVRDGTSKTLSV